MNIPKPIDIDTLPEVKLDHETVQIEGGRNLYRFFVPGEDEKQAESEGQAVSLDSPQAE